MAHPRQTGHHLQRHPRPDLSYPFPRVQQEYEEVLPYHAFAVRIPQHAIYRLPEILDELMQDPEKVSTILAGTQRLHEQPQNVSLCISWCFICPPLPSAATVGGVLRSHPGKGGRGQWGGVVLCKSKRVDTVKGDMVYSCLTKGSDIARIGP